jgi:hypothetical protein
VTYGAVLSTKNCAANSQALTFTPAVNAVIAGQDFIAAEVALQTHFMRQEA